MSSRTRAFLRWSARGLFLAGLAAIGWDAASLIRMHIYDRRAAGLLARGGFRSQAMPARGAIIGRVDIPGVGVSAAVLEGDDEDTLRLGVGHIPFTALPGAEGNVGLAGHRDTVFRNLRKIRRNDPILLTTPEGSYAYVVDSIQVLGPRHVEVLRSSNRPMLTLITCYPFTYIGSAPERFVVQAHRIGYRDANPAGRTAIRCKICAP